MHCVAEAHTKELGQGSLLGTQTWSLSHVLVVNVDSEHDGLAQAVFTGGYWQPLSPSHSPFGPHGALALATQAPCGAAMPAITGRHCPSRALPPCPFRARVQAEQPVQASSQHTPSAQISDVHWALAEQVCPSSSVGMQAPVVVSQYEPASQEVDVQLIAHLALPSLAHRLLGHVLLLAVVQAPPPLQTDSEVTSPLEQVASAQTVLMSG